MRSSVRRTGPARLAIVDPRGGGGAAAGGRLVPNGGGSYRGPQAAPIFDSGIEDRTGWRRVERQGFVSRSGRIRIDPADWHFQRAYELRKTPLPKGFVARFRVLPMFADVYEPPRVDDRTRESILVAASGLKNEAHQLELVAETGELPKLQKVRIYTPALRP